MFQRALWLAVLASVFLVPARADFAAGQRAWDAGRVDEALAQWSDAAHAGDGQAMRALGQVHLQGFGVLQDFIEAHKWFNLAASRGDVEAAQERDALAGKMTPEQAATAQERAAAWRPSPARSEAAVAAPATTAAQAPTQPESAPQPAPVPAPPSPEVAAAPAPPQPDGRTVAGAARAKTDSAYYWGEDAGLRRARCSRCDGGSGGVGTVSVGDFPPNGFGLFDVLGNVREWVEDCGHRDYTGAPSDGSTWTRPGDCRVRMLRGGSWADAASRVRSAMRNWKFTDTREDVIGFRVARTLR